MHIRHLRAAVAAEPAVDTDVQVSVAAGAARSKDRVSRALWASRPLCLPAGRLIGVRMLGESVQVALVRQGVEGLRWVPAETTLTEQQARLWVATARFAP